MWPLVNPDLFSSLGDTLEDVMQASLPKLVRMVSVDDIGQGSEAVRILGVRWLPAGAATESVTADGKITSDKSSEKSSKGSSVVKSENTEEQTDPNADQGEADEDLVSPGLLAEEGEFINLEIAFAYRTRSQSKSFKAKSKDMHIYLAFFLPGNIKIPVWVDLHGIVGTMRLRLQLTPDPLFRALHNHVPRPAQSQCQLCAS
uniref:SMP-LTD domain-containing protein n=1 Tax=Bionectria ochroleuca TaxID=29856 RepID=A0A8H7N7I4_BIOOC